VSISEYLWEPSDDETAVNDRQIILVRSNGSWSNGPHVASLRQSKLAFPTKITGRFRPLADYESTDYYRRLPHRTRLFALSIKIIQITDLHVFADPAARLKGIPTRDTLADVLAQVQGRHSDLDYLIITGDHTHDELPETYQQLADMLSPWKDRMFQIPGNHDDRALIRDVFAGTGGPGECVTFSATVGEWKLIGLDSQLPGEVAGRIEPEQLAWLQARLNENPNQPTALFVHHPPVSVESEWMDAIGIQNAGELVRIIEQSPQVRLVCSGHVHHEFESTIGTARFFTTPSTGIQFDPAGDSLRFTDLPPGYRVVILDGTDYKTHVERLAVARYTPVIEETE
jgi:Icc protein